MCHIPGPSAQQHCTGGGEGQRILHQQWMPNNGGGWLEWITMSHGQV